MVHKPEDLTDKERLSERDDFEASFVPCALALNESFLEAARRVAGAPPGERKTVARTEARRYVSNRGEKQDLIVHWLMLAADEPWKNFVRGAIKPGKHGDVDPETYFANLSQRPVWGDEDPNELDGHRDRIGQSDASRRARLRDGARRFVNSGAGNCIECGLPLAGDRLTDRRRHLHCAACEDRFSSPRIRDSHFNSIREAMDAATRQHRKRRASRGVK